MSTDFQPGDRVKIVNIGNPYQSWNGIHGTVVKLTGRAAPKDPDYDVFEVNLDSPLPKAFLNNRQFGLRFWRQHLERLEEVEINVN